MFQTHTPAEWGGALVFGSLSWLACSFFVVSLAPVGFGRPTRDAAATVAVLLMLLTPSAPEATR